MRKFIWIDWLVVAAAAAAAIGYMPNWIEQLWAHAHIGRIVCAYTYRYRRSLVSRDSFNLIIRRVFVSACIHAVRSSLFLGMCAGQFHCMIEGNRTREKLLTKIPSTNPFGIVGPKSGIRQIDIVACAKWPENKTGGWSQDSHTNCNRCVVQ